MEGIFWKNDIFFKYNKKVNKKTGIYGNKTIWILTKLILNEN